MVDGPLLGVAEPVCRRCGRGLGDHLVLGDDPLPEVKAMLVEAEFGVPFDGLYCPRESPEQGTIHGAVNRRSGGPTPGGGK